MDQKRQEKPESEGFWQSIGSSLLQEGRAWIQWAGAGAVLGGVVLGGAGGFLFGFKGALIGLSAGVVVGGIGAWVLYLFLSSS